MFNREEFEQTKRDNAARQYESPELRKLALDFLIESDKFGYGYQWTWLDMPFIQMPQDTLLVQEIIWQTKPDVIIETGVAWGGSIVFYASLMQLYGRGHVVGIDLNLYDHVAERIMSFPFSNRISLYKGSSTDAEIVASARSHIRPGDSVMVLLDSNHTHAHVLDELRLYAPLVTKGQFLVVSDTIVEDVPVQTHRPRPWGPGNNPKTALDAYLQETPRFEVDPYLNRKALLTYSPNGYLRCVAD